jgi:hypothetical protein
MPRGTAGPHRLWGSYMWGPGPPGWGWANGWHLLPAKHHVSKAEEQEAKARM